MNNKSKNFGLFIGFIIILVAAVGYGIFYVFNNVNSETYTFNKDGYALYVNEKDNYKTNSYSFKNGSSYSFKKTNGKISFDSNEKGNVNIDDSTVVHYTDNSLLVLKNVVGLNLNSIDSEIILYYNIFKNTNIVYENGAYVITTSNGEKINFTNLLLRINENKYLFMADSVRATIGKDEVVDFGKYVYIEYSDGSIVGIYNNSKSYRTIGNELSLVSGNITINMKDKSIAKEGEKYITLSNLVLDSNSNIDLIPEEVQKAPEISSPNIDSDVGGEEGEESGGTVGGNGGSNPDNNVNEEVTEDPDKIEKVPQYKVVNMQVSSIKLDAEIEIIDEDSLIVSTTEISVVDNSSLRVVYETIVPAGDTTAFVSTAGLSPDTEYTIYAKATYKVDEVEYTKSFVNKIFRTEALGVSFEKSYATTDSIVVNVDKKAYSSVSSVVISLYDERGGRLDYKGIDFSSGNNVEVAFTGLTENTKYLFVMHDVLCGGVVVEEGYSEEKEMYTLKTAPTVGNLQFQINKRTSKFELSVKDVKDPNYGIVGYRYEIFDVRQDMNTETPLITMEVDDLETVSVNVDEVKLLRGSAYTYRLIVIFNDNDKIVEYVRELGQTMKMEGVAFPTIRFDETYVTWEQINGTIVIDDPNRTIEGDAYRVVYKNAVDVYTTNKIIASTSEETIPIAINNLRKNETYTFQVYADVNLKDGNDTIKEAYIGSVIVKTKDPNDMQAIFTSDTNYNSAFSVNLRLGNVNGKDASLEASTISEMTLTLYQGSSTNGAIEVSRKVVDVNEADYVSTIKQAFYDAQALINPAFFDANNDDFREKTYTLEVSKVYDYTQYKNEIFIQNNTFTFSANSYVPSLPSEDAKPVNVTEIVNKNADGFGLTYDENLEPNTVVGYNVISNYANEAKNAKKMVYHVWAYNQLTGIYEIIMDREVLYDEDGNTSSVVFPIGYGTANDVFDGTDLRRGNEYYFSYEVYLDIDGDGYEDSIYPKIVDENVVLKSDSQFPPKQKPIYKMYPLNSTGNSVTWNYMISDIDSCLNSNHLYAFVGNEDTAKSSSLIIVGADKYNSVPFSNLSSSSFYSIKASERVTKNKEAKYVSLSTQYLYPLRNSLDLNYSVEVSANTLIIRIDDYENKAEIVDSIASADVTLTPVDPESDIAPRVLTGVLFDNGVAYVNLLDVSEFIRQQFKVGVKVYFDSGNTGFEVQSDFKAIQAVTIDGTGNYYSVDSNKLVQNSVITGSEFTTNFNPEALLIEVTDKRTNNLVLPITISERGVIYDKNTIVFKELLAQDLNSTLDTATFELLVPNISLTTDNKLNIISLLTSVEVKAKLTIIDGIQLQNNLIYIDIYTTDKNGTNAVYYSTMNMTPEQLESSFMIENLLPQSNYYINFYTYIYNTYTGVYDKYYLYDEDQKALGVNYNFHTLSDVGIDNINAQFVIDSYEDKKIDFSYTLESIYGYDYIQYTLYEYKNGEFVKLDIDIPKSVIFFNSMSFSVDASPGNEYGFAYNKTYKIVISPIGSYVSDGQEKLIDLGTKEQVFTLIDYVEPYIGISGGKTDSSIFFRVSIDDTTKVISGGTYTAKLMDSSYTVLKTITNISANTINKRFEFSADEYNLQDNTTYVFVVSFDADYKNSGANFKTVSKTRSIKFGSSVNLGSVTASKNKNDPYTLDIIFADSYLLTSLNKISYTVSSTTISYFSTGTDSFSLTYNPSADIYTYQMKVDENANFKEGNMYTITMNFYTGNNLIVQEEINYYYGG